jgi:sugar phosphate permease
VKRRQVDEAPPQPGYQRRITAFLLMMVIGGGAGASINSFLTLYMVDELGASKEMAAMLLSVIYSSGLWAGPVGGYFSDRIGSVKIIIISGIISGLLIFTLKTVTLGFGLYAVLWAIGFIQAVRFPVTEVFIMSQTTAKRRSTMYGVYYSTMQYTGAIFAPIMGTFLDKYGFDVMLTFSGIVVTAMAIITSFFIWDARA